ncbi:CRTAC1 family protein [Singulisphaera sp. PoT]|uniref:CRTAC1 family protein n=1 Tax=Singulisphaera sp. PoT TaxID=3411797 RepID=UPI003BF571ED
MISLLFVRKWARVAFASLMLAGIGAVGGCTSKSEPTAVSKAVAPAKPPEVKVEALPTVKFVEITKDAGLTFKHSNGATGDKLLPETMGSGVAFLDYDGDGDQDLYFVNSSSWPGSKSDSKPTQALYRNDGKGNFDDVTKEAGLGQVHYGMGVAVGDYDNDGDPDLYISALGGGILYRNDGAKFVDVTGETGAKGSDGWLTSATFFDLENDGDLDLFVCCYVAWSAEVDRGQNFQLAGTGKGRAYGPPNAFQGGFCVLLRNDSGKFSDVSEDSGIRVRTPELKIPMAKSLGVAPYDIDGDGFVDLAIANDTVPNFLFHNMGGGKFEEIGATAGIGFDQGGSARGAMGIDWAHFKNDPSLGLAIGNFANEMTALYVTDEPPSLQFSDLANLYGLGAPTQPPLKFGLFFFDYDLDGRLDLLSTNGHLESDIAKVQASETYEQSAQLFWNTGLPGRSMFALVGADSAGPDLFRPIVGRGSAYADIDGDGDLDVVLTANGAAAHLFRNDGGDKNRWLRLKLKGQTSNRDGIGAKVVVKSGEVEQRRQLFPAKGYLSSVELPLTFGLGSWDHADDVSIVWPSGKTTAVGRLDAGRVYTIDEEAGLLK